MMSNRSRKPPKSRRQGKRKPRKKSEGLPSIRSVILGITTVVGGIAALFVFVPRPSVTPVDPTDPSNLLTALFTVSNESFVPLEHVSIDLALGFLGRDANYSPVTKFKTRLNFKPWQDHYLAVDDRLTVPLSDAIHGQAEKGDIEIVIGYNPWIIPWRIEKAFRFKSARDFGSDNKYQWLSTPIPGH
jgi:hypothetical protein